MNQTTSSSLIVVILAAGKGLRMQSELPKVLHPIAKQPMLGHILKTAQALNPHKIMVIHAKKDLSAPVFEFIEKFKEKEQINNIVLVEQSEQLGTGDAVSKAVMACKDDSSKARLLILCGDAPLISVSTLETLIDKTEQDNVGMVTAQLDNPTGLGRIIRNAQKEIQCIVEEKEATSEQRAISEVNSGLFLASLSHLQKWLPLLNNRNASKEYYLTDIVGLAVKEGVRVVSCPPEFIEEILGVNNRVQQLYLERFYQNKLAQYYLQQGVWIADPARFDLRGHLSVKTDVAIDVNVILEGNVSLGKNTSIGPNCVLINCDIGDDVQILANSHLENVKIGNRCSVGPFARLRPGAHLEEGAKIGNFVEVKNSFIGLKSKINHLSYIGDAHIGANVNIGAGTITCNYDGVNKHKTTIEDNVNIGSDTQLVAPIVVGQGSTIAAGSTLTKDVPAHQLTLTHQLNQRSKDWKRPERIVEK